MWLCHAAGQDQSPMTGLVGTLQRFVFLALFFFVADSLLAPALRPVFALAFFGAAFRGVFLAVVFFLEVLFGTLAGAGFAGAFLFFRAAFGAANRIGIAAASVASGIKICSLAVLATCSSPADILAALDLMPVSAAFDAASTMLFAAPFTASVSFSMMVFSLSMVSPFGSGFRDHRHSTVIKEEAAKGGLSVFSCSRLKSGFGFGIDNGFCQRGEGGIGGLLFL
jgi:hypothetical protein